MTGALRIKRAALPKEFGVKVDGAAWTNSVRKIGIRITDHVLKFAPRSVLIADLPAGRADRQDTGKPFHFARASLIINDVLIMPPDTAAF